MKIKATPSHPPADVDPHARSLIRHKVRRLRAAGALRYHDAEDLSQDLALHAHVAAPKYDAARGARTTFYETVLARRLATLLASRSAQKRDHRRARPLDRVPEQEFAREPSCPADLVVDVRDALATLPHDLRPVADLFTELTEAEVIRASGLSRQQVRGRRQRSAQHLRRRGLA